MASKVNKKFVVLLTAGVLAAFVGVAGVFLFIKSRSGEWNASRGETAMTSGDLDKADTFYSRAVSKDPTNVAWLKRWREIREKRAPDLAIKYREDFRMLVSIYQQIAIAQRTNIEAHRDALQLSYQQAMDFGAVRELWSQLVDQADGALKFFSSEQPLALRRYRALGISALAQIDPKTEDKQKAECQQDLEEVVKADPKDIAAFRSLAQLHASLAEAAKSRSDSATEARERDAAVKLVAAMLSANPSNPEANLIALYMNIAEGDRLAESIPTVAERNNARLKRRDELRPELDHVVDIMLKSDPATLTPAVVGTLSTIASAIKDKEGPQLTLRVVEHALTASPNSALLLMLKAQTLEQQQNLSESLAVHAKIAALPNLPLSWEGMKLWELRRRAIFAQANVATSLALTEKNLSDRAPRLAKARELRQELFKSVSDGSSMLTLVDAKLALADKKYDRVEELLAKLLNAPGEVVDQIPQALLLLANVCLQPEVNKPGDALRYLKQYDDMRPGATAIRLQIASTLMQLSKYDEADSAIRRVLDAEPKNAEALAALALNDALRTGKVNQIADPVQRALIEASRMERGDSSTPGDSSAAVAHLASKLEECKYDKRVTMPVVQHYFQKGQTEKAVPILEKAITAKPDEVDYKRLLDIARAGKDTEKLGQIVKDRDDRPEWQRELIISQLRARSGDTAEADAAFARAVKLAPEEPAIIAAAFDRALARKDMDEAGRVAQTAAKVNADGAQGDTFTARIAMAKGNLTQAADILQGAVARGSASVGVQRTLGLVQLEMGKGPEAIRSIQAALEANPADVLTVRMLIEAYARLDKLNDALQLARKSESVARQDPDFVQLWLSLESRVGNPAAARQRREQMAKQNPEDLNNLGALAELLIQDRKWPEAREYIDKLKASKDVSGLQIAALEARWYADQADTQSAIKSFLGYINTLKEDQKLQKRDAYLALGQFLLERNDVQFGIKAYGEAARFQDEGVHDVQRLIADEQLRRGLFEDAEKSYRDLLASGQADPRLEIRKRLVETLVQQEKFPDAEREISSLGERADADVELMLLRANAARGAGDTKRAREVLDRAIARFRDEPLPYVRRARLLMLEENGERDALDDLDAALAKRPGMWQALRTRAGIRFRQGKTEDGLNDMIAAMESASSQDAMRFDTIRALLRSNQEARAFTIAEDGLKSKPTNLVYIKTLGDLFAEANVWPRAARFYRDIWLQTPEFGASLYTNALLSSTPPNFAEAEAMLKGAGKIEQNANLLMVRATIRNKQKKTEDAQADIRASIVALPAQDPRALESWYRRLRSITGDPAAGLAAIRDLKGNPAVEPFLQLWRGRMMVEAESTRDEGVKLLTSMAAQIPDKMYRAECYRSIMSAHTVREKWEEAAAACRAGLEIFPDDAWFLNNLSFILSDHQGKGQEAIDMAERAVKSTPGDWNVLDTLATVYWTAGQKAKAFEVMARAIRLTNRDTDRAKCLLKTGKWKLEAGDRSGAAIVAYSLRELMVDEPGVGQTLGKDIEKYFADAGVR